MMLNMPIEQPPALYCHVEVNKSHDPALQHAYEEFLAAHPRFAETEAIDQLRAQEYARLDKTQQIYLDYTGGSLYAESQLCAHKSLLKSMVFGNPHSINPTSALSTHYVEQARHDVLAYFNASPDEYAVIFTQNASGALKLLGESYPFQPDGNYLLTFDNHNSVNGIREFAHVKGAHVTYVPSQMPDMRVDESLLESYLDQAAPGKSNLFAFPAQSNFSGVQHPLEWIARAQAKGWDVLLDAAAFVPTNKLDLSVWHPDFVDLSFYKMFGYPTGMGCLIAKHEKINKLVRPWFAGGTIEEVSILGNGYVLHDGFEAFEDGTVNYLHMPAVSIGLQYLQKVGVGQIHARVSALTDWLLQQLNALHHTNGKPLVRIYGPQTVDRRGGTLAMHFFDCDGTLISLDAVDAVAGKAHISLRTGCFCNPGCFEMVNGLTAEELLPFFAPGTKTCYEDYLAALAGRASGAVRVSLGIASNFADVYAFVQCARTFIDQKAPVATKSVCGRARRRDAGC